MSITGQWTMERILKGARKLKASDIHLLQDLAPVFRVNGEIRISEGEPLTAETLQALLDEMINDAAAGDFCPRVAAVDLAALARPGAVSH